MVAKKENQQDSSPGTTHQPSSLSAASPRDLPWVLAYTKLSLGWEIGGAEEILRKVPKGGITRSLEKKI